MKIQSARFRTRCPTVAKVHHCHTANFDTNAPLKARHLFSKPAFRLGRIPADKALTSAMGAIASEMELPLKQAQFGDRVTCSPAHHAQAVRSTEIVKAFARDILLRHYGRRQRRAASQRRVKP